MILQEYVNENRDLFFDRVTDIAYLLGIPADWLMAVMYKESTLNHRAVNPSTGATGLIQFMPSTATSLGTTTSALKNMQNFEQLEYVYHYLKPYASKFKTYVDVYLAVFFPAAIGKEPGYILRTSTLPAELVAQYNPGLDYNHDFVITKAEVEQFALASFPPDIQTALKKKSS